jgi:hypothetical protein
MSSATLRKLVVPAVILGIVLVVVAIVYFVEPAKSLPSFFPGHVSAANQATTTPSTASRPGVALACFAIAWLTGPKTGCAVYLPARTLPSARTPADVR